MMNNLSQGLGSFNNMMPQNNMGQQNPYGQQMNPQMMGQQMRSPEMFSEQLMEPNQMNPMQDPMQGLQPMAEPEGFGVYGQSLEGFADGGAALNGNVPRETMISGQPHMLAYINPEEEQMLYNAGGSGDPGPGGIPAFNPNDQGQAGVRQTQTIDFSTPIDRDNYRDDRPTYSGPTAAEIAAADTQAQNIAYNAASRREANIAPAAATQQTGIMGIVDDVKAGFKNLVSDVKMTYAGGLGSFSDLNDETNYNTQFTNLTNQGYEGDDVTRYLDTTKDTQAAIRLDYATPNAVGSGKDERLANEAAAASTAVGTGIDTIPISTSSPTGAGTVGTTYGGLFTPSSDFDATTGEIFGEGNTYGAMSNGSQLIKILGPGGVIEYQILDPSGSSILRTFDNFQDAYQLANSKSGVLSLTRPMGEPVMLPSGPVEQTMVEQTMPEVGSPNAVVPFQPVPEPINTQVPAATVDPMTPVGGDFLLPGQQNYGPTPAAALNFNPNTYMQTPQNASVALPSMFQQSNPYTFEELLSQYKPAYEPIL